MRRSRPVSEIDMSMLGLLTFMFVFFAKFPMTQDRSLMIAMVLSTCCFLYVGLRGIINMTFFHRLVLAVLVYIMLRILRLAPGWRFGTFEFYLILFCLFSPRATRAGAALRLTCGLLAGILVFSELPVAFGLPLAVTVLLVFVGGLISLWSDMSLNRAFIWFAKRAIRKETVFLIFFIAGITAIGLRQAQNYASFQAGLSGLSSSIMPGSMKSLSLSPSLAMRVIFEGAPPSKLNEVYFRGAVMDKFAGFAWLPGPSRIRHVDSSTTPDFSYKVALSPRYAEFAPVLDYGVSMTESSAGEGGVLIASGRDNGVFSPLAHVEAWRLYRATSRAAPVHKLDADDRSRMLQTPRVIHPKILDLAKEIGGGGKSLEAFTNNLVEFYRSGQFRYSLDVDGASMTLEGFLLKGRSGYCEHYAAASASIARLAGIPARVVAGFLGGTWDADSQTLFVRDLDAHAWNEFWDSNKGEWVRFDGVNFVAPERVALGSEYFLRSVGANIPDPIGIWQRTLASQFFIELDNFIATVKTGKAISAAEAIIEHGEEIALTGALGLTISFILLIRRRHSKSGEGLEAKYVRQMIRFCETSATTRFPGESLYAWFLRCSMIASGFSEDILTFAEAHARYCYGRNADRRDLIQMRSIASKLEKTVPR